jgi:hypothetical protein
MNWSSFSRKGRQEVSKERKAIHLDSFAKDKFCVND